MKNHVIICGFGRNGQQVATELFAHKKNFVVVDKEFSIPQEGFEKYGKFIEGDATIDETLQEANIEQAHALITTLPLDADNLYIALTARSMNPGLNIISRAADINSEKKLKRAGVNSVVMPERVGGSHMASLVARPDIIEFMEHLSIHGEDPTHLEEIACSELPDHVMGKTIHELNVRTRSGVNIIGFKTQEGNFIMNPMPDTKIEQGTKLFILASKAQINSMMNLLK
jgi:voltage-gated potassium channel